MMLLPEQVAMARIPGKAPNGRASGVALFSRLFRPTSALSSIEVWAHPHSTLPG
jgi:hypothetical protein